ncbi:MAG TPA: hypothetical protein PLY34_04555 [Ferruginibacter sp.]|nr:hypothetical protein [Ferruginibacter sp.]
MKKTLLAVSVTLAAIQMQAQNVGIGTNTPAKKLSVRGTIVVDHDEENNGSMDSASLLFGKNGLVGITSNKLFGLNSGGIDLWTAGFRRFSINNNGNTGIGILPNNNFRLQVNGKLNATGNISTDDSLYVNGGMAVGTNSTNGYRLRVDGTSRFSANAYMDGSLMVSGLLEADGGAIVLGTLEGYAIRANNTLRVGDYAAIGGLLDSNFRLRVYNGSSRFGGSVEATGNMTIGGTLDETYRLRVIGGNSRFGGDAQVTGRMAIGGDMDDNYRLRVYDGNSRFGGNAEVTGLLDVGGNINLTGQLNAGSVNATAISIGGKGAARSDGPSPLRIGFNSKTVDVTIPGGATIEYTVNITDFTGDNDDVRVMVSQFQTAFGSSIDAWERMLITVSNVDAAADTCKINIHNTGGGQLTVKGTIYLTAIAKN